CYPALSSAAGGSASPQIRAVATLGGNLLQRPRCWYFRAAEYRCLRKGGGHCFAIDGESQHHAVFGNQLCAIVHPSTAATVLVGLGAVLELTGAEGATRNVSLEDFLVTPDRDLQGEKDSFDWPLADVAVALDFAADGPCRRAAIVLGAAAPVPHRAKAAEALL